jgi:hypothetical protein
MPKRQLCDVFLPGKNNILVVGDSMAMDAYNALVTLFPDANIVHSGLGGCPPYDEMGHLVGSNWPRLQECIELNRRRFDPSYFRQFDVVAIDVLYGWYKPEHLEHFLSALRRSASKIPILVFGNYVQLSIECGDLAERLGIRACGNDEFIKSKFLYEDELKHISRRYGATFVSEKDAFCQNGECEYALGMIPFTWDKFHLSFEFAVELARRSEKQIRDAVDWRGDDAVCLRSSSGC